MSDLTYSHFDKHALLTMQLANQSAWKLNHDFIDTEHILIGVCRNLTPRMAELLAQFDVSVEQLLTELERRVRRGHARVKQGKRDVRPNAKRVTEQAVLIASHFNASAVSTSHVLLGLIHVESSVAADVLTTAGIKYDDVIARITET